jgi:hypothetical protein
MKKLLFVICLLVFAVASPAAATPSTAVWIPSTDIQPADKVHFGIDNYFTAKSLQAGESTGAFTTPTYGLTFGFNNGEAGIDYVAGQRDPLYFNFKFKLAGKAPSDLNVVAGVYNIGTTKTTNQEVKYILTSVTDANNWRYSLGYGVGRKDALGTDNKMLLASIDKQLNDKWWVCVDYQSGKSVLGALNIGFSYAFAPNASVLIGYDIYNDRNLKNTITTQLDINF